MAMIPFVHEKITVAVSCSYGLPGAAVRDARPQVHDLASVDIDRTPGTQVMPVAEVPPEFVRDGPVAVFDVAVDRDVACLIRAGQSKAPLRGGISP